jgi:hypothetical protein
MQQIAKEGVSVVRQRKHKHGQTSFKEVFKLPKKGYLFKSRRKAGAKHLGYHAVYAHIKREAPRFLRHLQKEKKPMWIPEIAKLRPHSGRATLITDLMGEGLSTALSTKHARHAPGSIKVHLRYGRLTLKDVQGACDRLERQGPCKRKWSDWSTSQLVKFQREIAEELEARHQSK